MGQLTARPHDSRPDHNNVHKASGAARVLANMAKLLKGFYNGSHVRASVCTHVRRG
jgi:hypothetical protein